VANLRVHVERANRRFKEYHLFDAPIPLSLLLKVIASVVHASTAELQHQPAMTMDLHHTVTVKESWNDHLLPKQQTSAILALC